MTAQAYPLTWPEGWSRTPQHEQQSGRQFTHNGQPVTLERAFNMLCYELERCGAQNIVVSTNHRLDDDGVPLESRHPLRDEGAAVYYVQNDNLLVMASDRFDNAAANLRSLGLAVEALRQLHRHGGGAMAARAFSGFKALAPPSWKKPWREVFGVTANWTGDVKAAYRQLALKRHPDNGGSDAMMAELNAAYEEAKRELGPQDPQRLSAKM